VRTPQQEDHEVAFVRAFIRKERVERWLDFLASPKRRANFLHRLADARDLRPGCMVRFASSSGEMLAALRSRGAPPHCHVISEIDSLDGLFIDLSGAMAQVYGAGLGTILSCVPGRLAFYQGERVEDRCLLALPRARER
jgi:hypothetical protein